LCAPFLYCVPALNETMPDQFYATISQTPDALTEAIRSIDKESQAWSEHFGFNAIELPMGLIAEDSALRAVHAVQPVARLGLLMVQASTFYKWHKDVFRQCCLNMLISEDHHSHTLFGEDLHNQNMKITELKYIPNTLYLFNNQAEHCVVNLDGPRYLFSLYFQQETPYEIVKNKLAIAGLIQEVK